MIPVDVAFQGVDMSTLSMGSSAKDSAPRSIADILDLKAAARAAGCKKIEMIPQKTLFPLTGYVHGGCSPVGMKKAFPTFIDETAQLFDRICVSGGKIGYTVSVDPNLLLRLVHGSFDDLTVR